MWSVTSDIVHNQEKDSNCGQPRRNDSELSEADSHFCCSCELNDLGKQPGLSKPQRPDLYSSEPVNEEKYEYVYEKLRKAPTILSAVKASYRY